MNIDDVWVLPGEKVYVAVMKSKVLERGVHAIGFDQKAVALECFSKALGSIKREWKGITEMVTIYEVSPSEGNVVGFDLGRFHIDDDLNMSGPTNINLNKLGAAFVSFLSRKETKQPISIRYQFLHTDKGRAYDLNAN